LKKKKKKKDEEEKKKINKLWNDLNNTETVDNKPAPPKMVTITETFDYAGEEIKISKQISADAKSKPKPKAPTITSPKLKAQNIDSILDTISGKKKKMSSVMKSKLDWDTFKDKEGITEELEQNKKSGFYLFNIYLFAVTLTN